MSTTKLQNEVILCSAGRGETTKTDCLKCALERRNTCGYDFSMLNAMYQDKQRTGIHVTDITSCLRKAYYDKVYPPLEFPHQALARFLGTAVHHYIEQFSSEHYDQEIPLAELGIVGTADVVYKDGRILDYKTSRWLTRSKLPYGAHVRQLNIYAAILRAMGKTVTSAAVQYIDMAGPSKCTKCRKPLTPGADEVLVCSVCFRPYPEAHLGSVVMEVELEPQGTTTEWIALRRQILEGSLGASITPEAEPSYLCDFCPFQQRCVTE